MNIPVKRTLKVMRQVYEDKLIDTNFCRSLTKLLIDTCTKTTFTFNDEIYKQVNGVSMGGALGPLMANIIMTELEDKVVRRLINTSVIKFY